MSSTSDPYWKLRPEGPKPPDEFCRCEDLPPVVLQEHLSPVPLACLRCNGEIVPEEIGISAQLAEKLASWRDFERSLMMLWLDSGEYEGWAATELARVDGPVNTRGLELVAELNQHRRTYLWWFQDNTIPEFSPLSHCPRCKAKLVESCDRLVCDHCSIVVPNG